jgi:recombination protein RecA
MGKRISMSDAQKEVLKFFGEETIFFDGNIQTFNIENAIPTGSVGLDEAIGVGGIPRGRIIQLAGKESSGKTMLSLSCIKNYLDKDPENTAMFIDAEYTYDPEWAEKLGVDTSRVMVIKTNDAAKIFDGLIGLPGAKPGKKKMKGILDHIAEGTDPKFKNMGIIVLDSVAVLSTPTENISVAGKHNIASVARFLSNELKKLTPEVAKANVAFVAINQVRVNVGQMFGDPTSSPGGKALKHACSLMVNMAPISGADSYVTDSNGDRVGHKVRAKIGKNKVGSPFRKAEYTIEYLFGIVNQEEELLDLAVKYKVIARPNNQSYEYMGEPVRGRANMIQKIKDNDSLYQEILNTVKDIYLKEKDISAEDIEEESISNPLMEGI